MLPEPAIVTWGRTRQGEYDPNEYYECMHRAFVLGRADFVVLDSSMAAQRFTAAAVAWAIDEGYMEHTRTDRSDEQCEVYEFRLTEEGRVRLSL